MLLTGVTVAGLVAIDIYSVLKFQILDYYVYTIEFLHSKASLITSTMEYHIFRLKKLHV
jgi:hypothetical protein